MTPPPDLFGGPPPDLFGGPPPRLVASDLDGTLLRSDNTASPRTRAALERAVEAGALLVLVTGRPARWMRGVAETTGHHGVAVISNGAAIYDLTTEKVTWDHHIPADQAREIAELLRFRVPDVTFAAERLEGYARETGYTSPYTDLYGETAPWQEIVGQPLLKLLVRSPAHDENADGLLMAGREVVGRHLGTLTHSSRDGLLEISAAGVDKASTLAKVAADRGIVAAEAVAFGDMPNDVPMLSWAGRSWALGDGHPMAKAAATAVTASLAGDGVAVVLERLFA